MQSVTEIFRGAGYSRVSAQPRVTAMLLAQVTLFLAAFVSLTIGGETSAWAQCPCSVFSPSLVPSVASSTDSAGVELGMKFRVTAPGTITALRFFKGEGNTGIHVGNLWRSDGTLLASATYSDETAVGWQQVNLTSPVVVSPSFTYVVSYYAPNGGYAYSYDYFSSQGATTGPLLAPASADVGGNGVYVYGSQSAFPNNTYSDANYWVDVVFDNTSTAQEADHPVLLVTDSINRFSAYVAEILLAEGLNGFSTSEVSALTPSLLSNYDVVVVGEMPLTPAQVTLLSDWVNAGGKLITLRPDKKLAPLLGLVDGGLSPLPDGYIRVNTQSGAGAGIVAETMQYHGDADLYTLSDATEIASLYSGATTPANRPAVTVRSVGANGGQAAAFLYDLARSVVYTRQGNPAWAGQDRDGIPAIRANDLFFPDYLNLNKVAIPQADEQQRLLANLIISLNVDSRPIPRFWYLPNGYKAAIIHTLDDHLTAAGTQETFQKLTAQSPAACNVDDWTCYRATSWVYVGIPVSDAQASGYVGQGFELGVHAQNGCTVNFTSFENLDAAYKNDLQNFAAAYPSVPPQKTSRFHCIVWSDWATQAKVQLANNIRFNLDYYYWPGSWLQGRPGLFTGSGLPMRFADLDGSLIDVYQGVSQLVNENDLAYPQATNVLLDRALGSEGFYGMFGTHDDYRNTTFLDSVISSARSRNVPIISAQQALTWLDGRNASTFSRVVSVGNQTTFSVTAAAGARNIRGMLPLYTSTASLSALSRGGVPVPFTSETIKAITYAIFPAETGDYVATYGGAPSSGVFQSIWSSSATPAVASTNDSNTVELGVKFRADVAGTVRGIRFYKGSGNTGTHVGTLWSETGTPLGSVTFTQESASGWQQAVFSSPIAISPGTTYIASYLAPNGRYAFSSNYFGSDVVSGNLRALSNGVVGGNGVYKYGGGFPSESYLASNYWVDVLFDAAAVAPPPSFSLWPSTALPSIESFGDTNAVELGVKFTTARAGLISGIRFFKGSGNSGVHTGTLWSSSGTPLATATFNNETATGWQEVRFSSPVPVIADTTYVASYFAPNGGYAVDANYFSGEWLSPPLRALSSTSSGGNGVYRYGGGFPDQSFNNTNYWVDVVFEDVVAAPESSLWSTSSVPTTPSYPDFSAVELGVKVQAARNGEILGVRFYKGANNVGPHVANVWNSTGALLGSAPFVNETPSGWQEVRFATPVPMVAGQTFIVSYLAPNGGYAVDGNFFGSPLVNGPLTALASSASGGNGVYKYGGGFPDQSFNSTNYWVDVLFR